MPSCRHCLHAWVCVQRGDRVGEFRSLGALGNTHVFSGDLQSARDYYQQQLSLAVHHRVSTINVDGTVLATKIGEFSSFQLIEKIVQQKTKFSEKNISFIIDSKIIQLNCRNIYFFDKYNELINWYPTPMPTRSSDV